MWSGTGTGLRNEPELKQKVEYNVPGSRECRANNIHILQRRRVYDELFPQTKKVTTTSVDLCGVQLKQNQNGQRHKFARRLIAATKLAVDVTGLLYTAAVQGVTPMFSIGLYNPPPALYRPIEEG